MFDDNGDGNLDQIEYERNKKQSSGPKKHRVQLKQIRLRAKTGQHDIDFKVKQAINFLKHKDKVQVSVVFRGREIAHVEEGRRVMANVLEQLEDVAKIEIPPTQQGRRIVCVVTPK